MIDQTDVATVGGGGSSSASSRTSSIRPLRRRTAATSACIATLKAQTSRPPAANAAEQQGRFDTFRRHYNEERPHEALGQRPPHEVYTPSRREMPDRLDEPWYDADHQVRRVRSSGEIMWKGERVFVTEALISELVGIAELETGDHVVRFCDRDIGLIDRRGRFRRFAPPRFGLCEADTGSLVDTATSGEEGMHGCLDRSDRASCVREVGVKDDGRCCAVTRDPDPAFKPAYPS